MTNETNKPPQPTCPYCGKKNPLFGVNFAGGEVPGMGLISTVTFSCASCNRILSVALTNFVPSSEFLKRRGEQIAASQTPEDAVQ